MSGWSQSEIEGADEVGRLIQLHTRFDALHDELSGLKEAQEAIAGIERRCARRQWHGAAIKAILGGMFTAIIGAAAWLFVRVFG